ncbi:hypothetical protein SCLCIDRAFT_136619 [Scleroderma citrinum Foug A]|uniref:XPG-I domain-containing protein n=1 Tax=Scleroderma citrinum Foug A TaxID=1036808 RepID=A0A0C3D180_9AGAM|nr:hypothetical protein SCLCIDRAFT_136619 [Scleroderma citrinum Foug A]
MSISRHKKLSNGHFQAVAPAASWHALNEFVVTEGFRPCSASGPPQLMCIGFDVSLWMHTVCNVFTYNHAGAGESPEIQTIFYQLVTILQMLLHAHFVFNGPQRPKLKCRKQVKSAPHFLTRCFQELISAFGFTWHEAPGEAEAELAKLNTFGVIDAIFSDDSDILMFGTSCVIRRQMDSSLQNECYCDVMEIYTEDALEHGAHLTQGGLLLIALMSGGDYNDGIHRCGIDIAQKLAHYGLGDTLLQAATTLPLLEFMMIFCVNWHDEVCQTLTSDPLGILQCKHHELGHTIQMMMDFPNPHTIASYLGPLTSWSNDQPGFNGIVSLCQPDVMIIARFCIQHFSWSVETLLDKMCGVWTAVAV